MIRIMKQAYISKQIEKYKQKKGRLIQCGRKLPNVDIRKRVHPILRRILFLKRILCGQTLTILQNKSIMKTNKPVIYAVTHIGKFDFEMVYEVIQGFFYALSGDWELMYGTIDDYFFRISGVIYIDTEDKEDRKKTYEVLILALKQGIPLLWCPEGIWNLSDSLPMLKLYKGIISAALETSVDIIPVAVEQKEKDFYINIGKNVCANDLKSNKVVALRDIMATLKWEIWETLPMEKRKNISSDYYNKFLKERISEWSRFNMEIINHREFRDKNITIPEEAFRFINDIHVSKNSMFLFMRQDEFVKKYCENQYEKIS